MVRQGALPRDPDVHAVDALSRDRDVHALDTPPRDPGVQLPPAFADRAEERAGLQPRESVVDQIRFFTYSSSTHVERTISAADGLYGPAIHRIYFIRLATIQV